MPKRAKAIASAGQVDEETQKAWVPAYGAMITNLMILFMVLWAYTQFRPEQISAKTVPLPDFMLAEEIKEELESVGTVVITRRKMTVTLPSAVLFDPGSDKLRAEALAALGKVAAAIAKSTHPVVVEGHTDDVPIRQSGWRSNYELSAARAFSVIRYFTTAHGIGASRLAARGYGPYHPKVSNDSDENRAQNRRIEIHLWVS
jgi:flagellar motor protein MotB